MTSKRRYAAHEQGVPKVGQRSLTQPQYQQLKLVMDVHAASMVVDRMMDGDEAVISVQ